MNPNVVRLIVCSLIAFVALSGMAQAQAVTNRIALVIGNSNYENAPLPNPVRDAALMTKTLQDVGFEVLHRTDLDRRSMKRAFLEFGKKLKAAGPESVGLVYYSGHGVQIDGENYLIPVGAQILDEFDVDIEGIRASSLLRTLRDAEAAMNIVVLDACRNNPFTSSTRAGGRGLAKMDAPTGTLLAYSTAPGRVAVDGNGRNSPYTKALSRAIKIPGAKIEEVFKTVRVNVMDRTQGQQVPWESSSLVGDFVFLEKPPEPEPEAVQTASIAPVDNTAVQIEYWKAIANSIDPALFESYIAQYPDGIFKSIAEARVASLNAALVAPEQDDGFAREKAVWETIKDSGSIGMLRGFVESFPDGVYANIAKAEIAELESRLQVTTRNIGNVDEEFEIWDSVKNARTQGELQVYLDTYPDGKYAKLARVKIAYLNAAMVTSNSQYPYDGKWFINGEAIEFRRPFKAGVCKGNDSVNFSFVVERGKIKAKGVSKKKGILRFAGEIDNIGKFDIKFSTASGTSLRTGRLRDIIDPGATGKTYKVTLEDGSQNSCVYELQFARSQ